MASHPVAYADPARRRAPARRVGRTGARRCARGRDALRDALPRLARYAAPAARARATGRPRAARRLARVRDAARRCRWSPSAATVAASCFPHSDVDVLVLLPERRRRRRRDGDRALLRRAVGHRPRARPRGAHDRRVRSARWRPTSPSARACSSTGCSPGSRALFAHVRAALRRRAGRPRVLRSARRSSSSSGTSSTTTPPTTSSRTSRRARAACATCRRCCGSRARRASAARGASSRARAHHAGRGARGVAAGAPDRRRCACGCTTSPAGARTASCSTCRRALAQQLGLADTPARARERAADAALLPRRASWCARSTRSCCRTCMRGCSRSTTRAGPDRCRVRRDRRAAARARRAAVRAPPGARCSTRSCTLQRHPRAQGHVGAHAARAVAQPASHRRARSAAIRRTARASCRSSASRAASRTSCGG